MIYSCIRTTLVVGGVGDERAEGEKCESLPACKKMPVFMIIAVRTCLFFYHL